MSVPTQVREGVLGVRRSHPSNPFSSRLQKRRAQNLSDIDHWIPERCCKLKCPERIGVEFCRQLREKFLKCDSSVERKSRLLEFVHNKHSSGRNPILINNVRPCWNFLLGVLDVSYTMVSNVRQLGSANASHLPGRLGGGTCGSGTKSSFVVAFLNILADEVADEIPNRRERHLPHGNKKIVYSLYHEGELDFGRTPCRESHFYKTWRIMVPHIRCRRNHGFSTCDDCVMYKERLQELARSHKDRSTRKEHLRQFQQHLRNMRLERAEYARTRVMASEQSAEVLSVIIDGADQSNFTIPKFAVKAKSDTGLAMPQKVTGVLFHRALSREDFLCFYTSADNVPGGANQTIDAFCRGLFALIEHRSASGIPSIPSHLRVQLDNTSKDNKNRFFFAFCDLLVHIGVFESVTVSFLPVGHTHEDIDRKFSHASCYTRYRDIVAVDELHQCLRESQGTHVPHVARILGMHNFSGAIDAQHLCTTRTLNVQLFRKFTFERDVCYNSSTGNFYHVSCKVSKKMQDSRSAWIELPRPNSHCGVFLKDMPEMLRAPPVQLKMYTESDLRKFATRVEKSMTRIHDRERFLLLKSALVSLESTRSFNPEWDFSRLLDLRSRIATDTYGREDEDVCDQGPDDGISYAIGDMVTVHCGANATGATPFWVGQIRDIMDTPGRESILEVQWFEVFSASETEASNACYSSRYRAMSKSDGTPFVDHISSTSVLVTFGSLTLSHYIPVRVQKLTADALDPFGDGSRENNSNDEP